jgi:hypothetical protein
MPFKSKAQRRKFYAMARSGEISPETVEKWEKETPKGKKLPEHVEKKASRREKQTAGEKIRRGALIGSATATGAGIGISGSAIHDLLQKRKLDKLEKIQKGAVKPHPMFSHPVAPGKSKEIQRLKRLVSRSSTGKALLATGLGATALGGTAYIADALSNKGKEKKAALEIDFYALRQAALEKVGGVDLAKVAFYEEMEKIAIGAFVGRAASGLVRGLTRARGGATRGAGWVAREARGVGRTLSSPFRGVKRVVKGDFSAPTVVPKGSILGRGVTRAKSDFTQAYHGHRPNPRVPGGSRPPGYNPKNVSNPRKGLRGSTPPKPTVKATPKPTVKATPKPTAATPPPAAPKPIATSAAPADQPFLQRHFGLTPGAEGGMLGGKGVSDWFSKLTPDQRIKALGAGGVGLAGGGFLAGKALGGGGDRKVVYV